MVLRGELIDIYRRHVPAFRGLPRDKVYEMVLNSPALASACHDLFRERPDLFSGLLIGAEGQKVTDPNIPLSCGKSLQEVTAMVVRAVARRHFLRAFRPASIDHREVVPPDFIARTGRRMLDLFRPSAAEQAVMPKPRRKANRGDSLYRALRPHLLHHWQFQLIPHYTPLPVALVRQLGARILDYRSTNSLQHLLLEGLPPATQIVTEAQAPLPVAIKTDLAELRAPRTDSKSQAILTLAWSIGLAKLFKVDEQELQRMVDHVSVTSGSVITRLSAQGLRMSSVVVLLCAFERELGDRKLSALFGPQASADFLDALAAQIDNHGVNQLQHPEDVKNRVEVVIRKMQRLEVLPS